MNKYVSDVKVDFENLANFTEMLQFTCQEYILTTEKKFHEYSFKLLQYGLYVKGGKKDYKYKIEGNVKNGGRFDTLLVPIHGKKYV